MVKKAIMDLSNFLSAGLEIISGTALMLIMLLTGADIVGRALSYPIPGTYEIVSFSGALVIGLAIPVTSRVRANVCVDIVYERVSKTARTVLHIMTRLMVMVLFVLLGFAIVSLGFDLRDSGEYTPMLKLPFYPVAWAMATACFIELVILVGDMLRGEGDKHE